MAEFVGTGKDIYRGNGNIQASCQNRYKAQQMEVTKERS